jgi:signal peptidase
MEPELNVGGVLVTKPATAETIKAGDIITFHSPLNNEVTSHRVIAIQNSISLRFQTKGDANRNADPYFVTAANLVGKGCFHLPYFGYVAQFIKTKQGFLLVICLPGLAVIIMEMIKIWRVLARREAENNYHVG